MRAAISGLSASFSSDGGKVNEWMDGCKPFPGKYFVKTLAEEFNLMLVSL